jgi:hypothetical protein
VGIRCSTNSFRLFLYLKKHWKSENPEERNIQKETRILNYHQRDEYTYNGVERKKLGEMKIQ